MTQRWTPAVITSPASSGRPSCSSSFGVGLVPPKRKRAAREPSAKVPAALSTVTSPEAPSWKPPASRSASTSRVPLRRGLRPGRCTAPRTQTNWLWYSLTRTATRGEARSSPASSGVTRAAISPVLSPRTSTSPARGSQTLPVVCTVGRRERSGRPSTTTSSTSPGPTRYEKRLGPRGRGLREEQQRGGGQGAHREGAPKMSHSSWK